jgi:hypothetical protein
MFARRIVRCNLKRIENTRLVPIKEIAKDSACQNRKAVAVFPGVEIFAPKSTTRYAVMGRWQVAAGNGNQTVAWEQLLQVPEVNTRHGLRIVCAA